MLGNKDVTNIKPVFRGFSGDITYNSTQVSLRTFFEVSELDKQAIPGDTEFRYTSNNLSLGPTIGPVIEEKEGV
jgi:hypothetical protein